MNNVVDQASTQVISKRRNARMLAVSVLYDLDINKYYDNNLLENEKALHLENAICDVLSMNQTEFLSDEFVTLFNEQYMRNLANKAYLDNMLVDEIISSSLNKYTIDRLSYVDRAIIRVSTAEMLIGETPKNIIIDEALEITKELSKVENDNQVKFNNRLLENIAGKVYGN